MSDFAVARYLTNGALDSTFSTDGKVLVPFAEGASRVFGVAIDRLDRVVAAGSVAALDGTQFAVARLLPNGDLDPSFNGEGRARAQFAEGPSGARSVAIDAQGRIVAAGSVRTANGPEFAVVRFLDDGQLDPSFNGTGLVRTRFQQLPGFALSVAIDVVGRIVVSGWVDTANPGHEFAVIRYRDDGSLDPNFSGDGQARVRMQGREEAFGVKLDARNRILIAGPSRSGGQSDAALARLHNDGTLDVTFGVNGRAYSDLGGLRAEAFGVALDLQGRIVVAGLAKGDLDVFGIARLLPGGDHDQTFSSDGRVHSGMFDTDGAQGVAVDSSGRVVAVGYTGTAGEGTVFGLVRLLVDGTADPTFGLNGQVFTNFTEGSDDRAHAVALDSQSRIVVAGAVGHPRDWPLARGPFRAGERTIEGIQVPNAINRFNAVVFYPATQEGVNAPFAAGAPFPLIAYAHGNRNIGVPVCPGTPTDFSQDFRQLSVISRHLARWGYVVICPDQSRTIDLFEKADMLAATIRRLLQENQKNGSPFKGKIRATGISLMGHSTGGGSAIFIARGSEFDVACVGTLAPGSNTPADAAAIGAPLLVILGTQDSSAVSGNGQQIFNAGVAPKHFVGITGANHFNFTDELCAEGDGPATIARADQQRIAIAYLTAFFQRYVRNQVSNASYLDGTRAVETLEGFGINVQAVT